MDTCKRCGIKKTQENCYMNKSGYWNSYCRDCRRLVDKNKWTSYDKTHTRKDSSNFDMSLFNKLMQKP